MKKLIIALTLIISCTQLSTAQQSIDDMIKEMEQLQKEMFKQFEHLDLNSQGFQFFMDTIITQDLGDLNFGLNDRFFEPMDPALLQDMFKQMEEQLSEMNGEDWEDLEEILRGFGQVLPNQAKPPKMEDDTLPKDKPAKNDKKKKKIYKI